jgi:hypothetical protein
MIDAACSKSRFEHGGMAEQRFGQRSRITKQIASKRFPHPYVGRFQTLTSMRYIMTQTETTPPEITVEVPTTTDSAEAELTNEIADMWRVHTQAQTSLHKTRGELRHIRTNLSHRLHDLKAVLSRPGRGGAWSSFLAAQSIPRSTADRLVRTYEKTIMADGKNCTFEQIEEPTEVVVRRYVRALWPRLCRVLTSSEAVHVFIVELHRTAERSFAANIQSSGPSSLGSSDLPIPRTHLDPPVAAVPDICRVQ